MLQSHSLSVCVSVLETGTCLISSHSPTSLPQSHDLWFSAQGHFWHFNFHFHCTTRKTSAGFQGFPPYRSMIWWQDMVDVVPLVLGGGAAVGHGAATHWALPPYWGPWGRCDSRFSVRERCARRAEPCCTLPQPGPSPFWVFYSSMNQVWLGVSVFK